MGRLSPGRILASIGAGLRRIRYAVEDVAYAGGRLLRRLPRAVGRALAAFWGGLGAWMRIRLLAAVAVFAALVAAVAIASPALPCELPGGEACPPPDDADDLVPAAALAYVHADLDPEGDRFQAASEVVGELPTITQELAGGALELVPGRPGGVVDLALDVGPWFGGEAAVALLPGGGPEGPTQQVTLLEIEDRDGAARFAAEIAGAGGGAEYRGIEIEGGDAAAAAELGGFLAVGPASGLRELIDVADGAEGAESLADDPAANEAREALPNERLGEAFLSPSGVVELIASATGALAYLAPLASPDATRGMAVAVGAGDGELEVAVRTLLEPDAGEDQEGFFAAFGPFEPELPGRLPEDALAYVGFGDPERTVQSLLAQASSDAPGVAEGFEGLATELAREGAIDVEEELLPALGDEAALVIDAGDAEAGTASPLLELVAREVDSDRAREALARLQGPVSDAFGREFGLQAPVFEQLAIDGVEAHSLAVSAGIELTHAVFDDLAVIATDPLGVERLAAGDGGLDDAGTFEAATDGLEDELSLLAFLDLAELVAIAELLGLAADPAYAAYASEIRALRAFGLGVDAEGDLLSADARLLVGAEDDDEPPPPVPEGPGPEPPLDDPPLDEPPLDLPPETPGFEPPPERDAPGPGGPEAP